MLFSSPVLTPPLPFIAVNKFGNTPINKLQKTNMFDFSTRRRFVYCKLFQNVGQQVDQQVGNRSAKTSATSRQQVVVWTRYKSSLEGTLDK